MELSKVAKPGTRIEVCVYESDGSGKDVQKFYASRISDVISSSELEIYMPTDKGKVIMFQVGSTQDLYFYTSRGMYQITSVVKDRYKDGGMFLLKVALKGELSRNQRREHYRYRCNVNMMGRVMDGAEKKWLLERGEMVIMEGEPMESNTIADISGGGIKFTSKQMYPVQTLLYCEIDFGRLYKICCIVLDVREEYENPGVYVHRAQFYGMENSDREALIKYIFDLELAERRAALTRQ